MKQKRGRGRTIFGIPKSMPPRLLDSLSLSVHPCGVVNVAAAAIFHSFLFGLKTFFATQESRA